MNVLGFGVDEREALESLAAICPCPIFRVDSSGVFTYASPSTEDVLGYAPAELDGRPFEALVSDESVVAVEEGMERLRAGEEVRGLELTLRGADGEVRYVEIYAAPLEGTEQGGGTYVQGLVRDVTAATVQAAELERQLDLFERSQRIADVGAWEHDVETGEVWKTAQVRRIHGLPDDADLPPEESIGYYHPEDRPKIEAAFRRAHEEGEPYDIELRLVDATGRERWVRSRGEPQFRDGRLTRVRGTIQDITERHRRERDLQKFREVVEQAGVSIYITDPDGIIEYVNPEFERATGYSRSETRGYMATLLGPGDHEESLSAVVQSTLDAGEVWEGTVVNRTAQGEQYTALQTVAPILEDGETKGYVAIQTDITDRELDQQRVDVLNRMLRHNLRNDINVVTGNLQDIARHADDECGFVPRACEASLDRCDRLLTQCQKARDVHRLLDRDEFARRPVDGLLRDLREEFTGCAGASLEVDTSPGPAGEGDGTTWAVSDVVGRALRELVENACEHESASTVRVEATGTDDGVRFVVADDGAGLPQREQTVLEQTTETPLEHSQGIGLWMAHWLVVAAGGELTYEEAPRGSRFTVEVPRFDLD